MSIEVQKIAEALTANEWTQLFETLRCIGSSYLAIAQTIEKRNFESFKEEISKLRGEDSIFLMSALKKIAISVYGTDNHFRDDMHGLIENDAESAS